MHRDVKLENLLFTNADADAEVMLCDFGMGEKGIRDIGAKVNGTLHNLSPETFKGQLTSAVDMWAVGVVTYELCCGTSPFDGKDDTAVRNAIINTEPKFTGPLWKEMSTNAIDFIKLLVSCLVMNVVHSAILKLISVFS